jgi:hypothetical protein
MSWYKTARRNMYQAVAKEITTYIFKRFKKLGADEEYYHLLSPQIYEIIQDVVKDENDMWDILSSMYVKYTFKDMDAGDKFNIVAGMNTMLELRVQMLVDLVTIITKPEKIYEDFYYRLYSAILHEMEHSRQVRDKSFNQDYVNMKSAPQMYELLNNYRTYLLQDIEIEAFAIGIYRAALSQNKDIVTAIREYAENVLIDINESDIKEILFRKGQIDEASNVLNFRKRIIDEFVVKVTNYLQSRFPNFKTV